MQGDDLIGKTLTLSARGSHHLFFFFTPRISRPRYAAFRGPPIGWWPSRNSRFQPENSACPRIVRHMSCGTPQGPRSWH